MIGAALGDAGACVREELATDAQRRRRNREQRRELLRQLEEAAAGPPPFRLTLAQARTKWPEWEGAQNDRREKGRRAATEKFGPIVADFLLDIHLPQLAPPTQVVAYALELECGHASLPGWGV